MIKSAKVRKSAFLATTGFVSILFATPAFADCAPDPTSGYVPIECTGVDSDGVLLTDSSVVNIQAGAVVASVTATSIPPAGSIFPSDTYSFLNVAGTVHSVMVESGQSTPYSGFGARSLLGITVAQGGVIDQGGVRLRLTSVNPGVPSAGNAASAWIDNSGLITSNSGAALLATDTFYTTFTLITNQQTGTIRGIEAPFWGVDNKGLIKDNGGSAIVFLAPYFGGFSQIENSGTITNSGGGFATIDVRYQLSTTGFMIRNSGTIQNQGAGTAIGTSPVFGPYSPTLYVENSGTISSSGYAVNSGANLNVINTGVINAGPIALYARQALNLRNYGTINGTVRADEIAFFPSYPVQGSSILLGRSSRINGDLILGAGDDVISIEYGGGALTDLVTGTIDGGGGHNSLRYYFGPGLTEVSNPLPAIFGFQFSGLEVGGGADARFLPGFALNGTLSVTAAAQQFDFTTPRLTNAANLVINDTAFVIETRQNYYWTAPLEFKNTGTIIANLGQPDKYALLFNDGYLINDGAIVANGGGGVWSISGNGLINHGSITADRTAVFASLVINTGTIRSNLGTGVEGTSELQNQGSITGATIGAKVGGLVINSGSISSPGTALYISGNGVIYNQAGGVISGQIAAIAIDPAFALFNVYTVSNAGTINGNVNLATGGYVSAFNTFEVTGNGTLNGNLYLGNGRLVVDYGRAGPLGGVTGNIVTTPGATLQYQVYQDLTLAFPARPSASLFTSVTWNLMGAKLTLTGPVPSDPYIHVEGAGASVDITANISTSGLRPIVEGTGLVTNLGTLTITHSNASKDPYELGVLATGNTVNRGTIIVKELAPSASGILARGLGLTGTVVNDGRILVSGGIGVAGSSQGYYGEFVNRGTITQLAGGAAGIGVLNTGSTTNYGTISTTKIGVLNIGVLFNTLTGIIRSEGPAVQFGTSDGPFSGYGGGMVVNEGLIESTKGVAIRGLVPSWTNTTLVNEATGTIKGKAGGPAIVIDGGGIGMANRGLIDGDVRIGLGGDPNIPFSFSSYYNEGGTLRGNLTFGAGTDWFSQRAGTVTGTVDGGAGIDLLILDTDGKVVTGFDLRKFRNFEGFAIYGSGQYTVTNAPVFQTLTINGPKVIVPATQTLTATNSTELSYGWLQVDGTLVTGNFFQGYNTVLSGSGTIDPYAISVQSGFVVPGGDGTIGRLTVKGNMGFDNGGALMIDVGTADSDRLVLKGDTTESGALYLSNPYAYLPTDLNLRAVGTGPRFGRTYTLITAEGGISGQFNSVQGSFGVLTPQLTYGANAVTLTFNASPLAAQLPQSATPLELSFAKSLDGLRASNYASLSSLYGTVDLLDPRSLGLALNGLNPHVAVEASGFYQQQNAQMFDLVTDRMALLGSGQVTTGRIDAVGLSGGVAGLANAPAASQFAAAQSSLTRSYTGQQLPGVVLGDGMSGFISGGVETRRSQLSQGAQQGADRRNWHMAMGLEMPLGDKSRLGIAVLHAEGISGRSGMQSEVVSSQAAAYATWQLSPRAYLGGAASMGVNHIGLQRQSWVDNSALNLTGRGTSFSYAVQAEAGYRQPLGGWGAITPHIGLRQSSFSIDRLNERGGQAALRLSNIGQNQLDMRVGLRFDAKAGLGSGWQLSPRAEVEYVRTLAGGQGEMTVQFAAVDAAGFVLPFGGQSGSALRAKGGLTLSRQQTSLTLAGSSEQDWAGRRDNRVAAELRFGF